MPVTINGSDGITNASWTTGTRPSNPVAGQIGYNTDLGFTEVYDGNNDEWQPLNPFSQQVVAAVSEATDINEAASFVGRGAIVESGTNANGSYVRWENGEQVCSQSLNFQSFSSGVRKNQTWTYPASFASRPHVTSAHMVDLSDRDWEVHHWFDRSPGTQSLTAYVYVAVSQNTSVFHNLDLVAFGRWK